MPKIYQTHAKNMQKKDRKNIAKNMLKTYQKHIKNITEMYQQHAKNN